MFADVIFVKMLKASMSARVKHYQDGDYFSIRHAVRLVAVTLAVSRFYSVFFDSCVEKFAEVVCHTKNFCNFAVG